MRNGFYAKTRRICASTNENLIGGEVWDRQEDLKLERQGARGTGEGTIRPQMFFEYFRVRSLEVEPFIDFSLGVGFGSGSSRVNDGYEFRIVPISNLVRLVSFIGHGNTIRGGPRREEVYYAGENIRETSRGKQ